MARDPNDLPEMISVKTSTNVQSFGYDPGLRILFVRFVVRKNPAATGPLYRYHKVDPGVFTRMRGAASKGRFVWDHVRENFRYDRWTGSAWRGETAMKKRAGRRARART